MKKVLLLFIGLFMILPQILAQNGGLVEVSLSQPGTLADKLEKQGVNIKTVTDLKVTGTINEEDFRVMNKIMTALTYIDISGTDIKDIPIGAFGAKTTLQKCILPTDIERIGANAFLSCNQLTNIPFGNKICSIESYAFQGCQSMTGDIVFPASLTDLQNDAFSGCSSLTSVDMSRCKPYQIPNWAFAYCTSLRTIKLPTEGGDGMMMNGYTIGYEAFSGAAITEITIPACITRIQNNAFSCSQLQTINIQATIPFEIEDYAFSNVAQTTCMLNVPTGSHKAYSRATNWSAFSIIEEFGIKVDIGENGTLTQNGSKVINGNVIFHNASETQFTIIPNSGYVADKVIFNNEEVPVAADNIVKIGAGVKGGTLQVTFALKKFNLHVKTEGKGQLKYNNELVPTQHTLLIDSGYSANFTLIPENGFALKSIVYNKEEGIAQQNESTYVTPYAQGDANLVVTFAPKSEIGESYKISTKIGEHGKVLYKNAPLLPASNIMVKKETEMSFSIVPDTYYMIDKVLYGQTDVTEKVTEDGLFTTDATTADATLEVSFRLNPIVTVHLENPGTLKELLPEDLLKITSNLTIRGYITESDFNTMRDNMPLLSIIDLSKATILNGVAMGDCIPEKAFSTGEWDSPSGKKTLTEIKLPVNITKIGSRAFANCIHLKKVNLEECTQLNDIGSSAFKGSGIISADLANTQIYSLKEQQFEQCKSLQEVTFPTTLQVLSDAFRGSIIKSLDLSNCDKVTKISSLGFEYLENVQLPKNIESIDYYSFSNTKLKSIDFSICKKLKNIGEGAFSGCEELQDIKFSSSIEKIEARAFYNCKLTSLDLSACTSLYQISEYAFSNNSLKSIQLPFSLTNIGKEAFYSCGISSILELPASLASIEEYAFANNNLTICKIAAITPPQIGKYAFGGDPMTGSDNDLSAVLVPENSAKAYKNANGWKEYIILGGENRVDVTVTQPGNLAIDIMEQAEISPALVTHLTVHGKLNNVDFGSMRSNMTVLYSLDLSDADAEIIPQAAFMKKKILMEFKAPRNLVTIEAHAFNACSALSGTFELPAGVTTIGDHAFSDCRALTEVKFPKKLLTIGERAFSNCSSLTQEITFPNTLRTIDREAFKNCDKLFGKITLPASLESIGIFTFSNCFNLKIVDLSLCSYLNVLKAGIFFNCPGLEEVLLPKNLNNISYSVFNGCSKLNNMVFPSTLYTIEYNAFEDCESLRNVDLSNCDLLSDIQQNAFRGCSALETINLPASLTSIGEYTFSGCRALANISVANTIPAQLGDYVFEKVNTEACVLSIPTTSYYDYLTAQQWGAFVQMRKAIAVTMTKGGNLEYVNNAIVKEDKDVDQPTSMRTRSTETIEKKGAIATNGSSIYVKKDETVSFFIMPEETYEIKKVLYNSEDVTSQVVNGTFTTPKVSDKTTLEITFYSSTVGVEDPTEGGSSQKLDVYTHDHTLVVRGVEPGVTVSVYSISGQLLKKEISAGREIMFDLPADTVYILRTDRAQTAKVVL